MDLAPHAAEPAGKNKNTIVYYQLDFLCNGSSHNYIWRQQPLHTSWQKHIAMLIDLSGIYVPQPEIEKMTALFMAQPGEVRHLAFAGCHAHNQQQIKRKLKAGNVRLYSRTNFFADAHEALQWLAAQ